MTTVMLIRHGRTRANADGVLAGTTPGVSLDDHGVEQAKELASRLTDLTPTAIISSPLQRTMQTASILAQSLQSPSAEISVTEEPGLSECNYGDWTGQTLVDLSQHDLWRSVQDHPSSVTFPGQHGESMSFVQHRAVSTIRRWNDLLGPEALYIAVSHGDVIKAILADALGAHLDHFQRIVVDPCSVSVIRYTASRPFVVTMNSSGDSAERFVQAAHSGESDAPVGGGTA